MHMSNAFGQCTLERHSLLAIREVPMQRAAGDGSSCSDSTLMKSNGWRMRACASPCEWLDAGSDGEAVLKKGTAVSESYLKVTRCS